MAEKDRFTRIVIRLPAGMTRQDFEREPNSNGSWYFKIAVMAEALWAAPGSRGAEAVDVELADGTFVRTMVGDPRPASESEPQTIPDTTKRCPDPQCDTLMDIDLRYCPACGTRAGLF